MRTRLLVLLAFAASSLAPLARAQDTAPEDLRILAAPAVHTDQEGTDISLALAVSHPEGVVFHAFNLPAGLTLDPATAVVSGILGPRSAGDYYVSIVAVSPLRTERVSFSWAVLESTQPTIENPGILIGRSGQPVDVALRAFDADEEPLTFKAYGLPRGLAIDAATGAISGTLAEHRLRTTYTVSITANDGHATGGVVFTWIVLPQ